MAPAVVQITTEVQVQSLVWQLPNATGAENTHTHTHTHTPKTDIQIRGTEQSPEINSHIYGQLMDVKRGKT